jgi:mitogen-activated protein kinase organizer 1
LIGRFSQRYEITDNLSLSAHDNAKFVSGGGDRTIFYWDVTTGDTIRRIPGHNSRINVVSLNDDASVVVSGRRKELFVTWPSYLYNALGSFDSTVKIWDLK